MSTDSDQISKEALDMKLVEVLKEYLQASRDAAREWQERADRAWDVIHGRINWAHKKRKQARIHLNKVGVAFERFKAGSKQGLVNFDEWLSVEQVPGMESSYMNDYEAKRFVQMLSDEEDLRTVVPDICGVGAVENILSCKISSELCEIKGPASKKRSRVKVKIHPLDIYTYYPDPFDGSLYEIHEMEYDKYQLIRLAEKKKSLYRLDAIKKLETFTREDHDDQETKKGNREIQSKKDRRNNIVVHEFWCTVLNDDGTVMVYNDENGKEIELSDVVITMANESTIISNPVKNRRYNGKSPFVSMQLLRSHKQKYGRSLLGPGVDLNLIENELVSALTDAAMKEAMNVNIIKINGLVDPKEVSGGITYNQTIRQNNSLAPGEKLIETMKVGQVPAGGFQVLGEVQRSSAENMLSNEMNMSGGLPSKQIRATELVQSQNIVNMLSDSIFSDIEDMFLEKLVTQIFQEGLSLVNKLSDEELAFIFSQDQERIENFKSIKDSPQAVFDELAYSFRFRGKGIKGIMANNRAAQGLIQLMTVFGSNPAMTERVESDISMSKVMQKILKGYSLDPEELKPSPEEAAMIRQRQMIREAALAQAEAEGQNTGQGQQGAVAAPEAGISETEPGNGAGF